MCDYNTYASINTIDTLNECKITQQNLNNFLYL